MLALRQVGQVDAVGLEPLAPRFESCNFALDFVVVDQTTVHGVGEEHLAWLQTSLAHDLGGVDLGNTDFGCKDDQTVFGYYVAPWAQTVTV